MRGFPVLVLALAAAAGAAAAAEPPPDPDASLSFVIENDKFGAGTDRQYTNGFRLALLSSTEWPGARSEWVRRQLTPLLSADGRLRVGLALGQSLFTPDDTATSQRIENDRPYAAWLYGAFSLVTDNGRQLNTVELSLGVIGPWALGEEVQNKFHGLINVAEAQGWANELDDEFGANLLWERKWRAGADVDGWGVDTIPNVSLSVGNVFTYASIGAVVRLGYDLPADYGPPRVRPALAGSGFFRPTEDFSWYLYGGAEGRAVLRDLPLDGNTLGESPKVSRSWLVGEASAGVVAAYRAMRLGFSFSIRSPEFEEQSGPVRYGGLHLTIKY